MNEVRIDKWLWAVRLLKTRSLAADYCKAGKVKINDVKSKSSKNININDIVEIKINSINYKYKVVEISNKRTSFEIAKNKYINITSEFELKKKEINKIENRKKGIGRPTKKERRLINEILNK